MIKMYAQSRTALGGNQEEPQTERGRSPLAVRMNKESAIGVANAATGGMSIISSYNICHSVCTAAIAMLAFFGVFITGMPLFFLTRYQLYFWAIGITMLIIATVLYFRMGKCISKHMLLANAGLLLAGFPFAKGYFAVFMVAGLAVVISAIALYFAERAKYAHYVSRGGKNTDKKITIAIIVFVGVFLGFVAYEVYSAETSFSSEKYQAAIKAQNPNDKCATPPGYTDAQWREHMGHHPDMYEECLIR